MSQIEDFSREIAGSITDEDGKKYSFPSELEERFEHLTKKIEYAKSDPDFIELYRGTKIVFNCEYKQYESKS